MISVAPASVAWALALVLCSAAELVGTGAASAESRPLPAAAGERYPAPPQELLDGLFVAVQSARIYADGKTFADAIPTLAPAQIVAQYHQQRPQTAEALRSFIQSRFQLPAEIRTAPAVHAA